jgi:hypothetical protein
MRGKGAELRGNWHLRVAFGASLLHARQRLGAIIFEMATRHYMVKDALSYSAHSKKTSRQPWPAAAMISRFQGADVLQKPVNDLAKHPFISAGRYFFGYHMIRQRRPAELDTLARGSETMAARGACSRYRRFAAWWLCPIDP